MEGRYDRQIMLAEVGKEGQERLEKARVLIVGVGGLGCPVALYLANAGVGTLGLVDDDVVSLSNLPRQVLYTEDEVGHNKVDCAARRLVKQNPCVSIEKHPVRLTKENASEIIPQYDLVIDGCDNAATRYLISDICTLHHIPYIYGGITAFEGQVTILCYEKDAPTYREIFPDEEKIISQPEKNEGETRKSGVIATTPAVIGCVQANEAIKLLCGYGSPLVGKMWTINLLDMQSYVISL